MKTLKKISIAAILLLFGSQAFAINPVVNFLGSKKLIVKLDNISENTQLSIKDSQGVTLFYDNIRKSDKDYIKTFDFSYLPDGSYSVEMEGELNIVSYPFSIVDNKIAPRDIRKNEFFKPMAIERGKYVYVSKYNAGNEELKVTVLNRDDNVVYTETLKGTDKLGKIFDFSKVNGEFKIAMSCNEKTYTKTVSIEK